jgi:ABC-type transport system involved in multi-copper enzyme maturation permease subunit
MNIGRIWAIAGNVFRETLREQVLYLTLLYSLILVAASFFLREFSSEGSGKMIVDTGIAAIEIVALIVAIFVGTNLINKEIEKRTIFVLVAKPMSRAEFVIGKHLGITGILALIVTLMAGIYTLILFLRGITFPVLEVLIACFFIFWQLMLVAAIAILFGSFTSSLIAALLTLASYFVGNFSRDLLSLGEVSRNEAVQQITRTLYLILPDLSRANFKNEAVHSVLPSAIELLQNGTYIFSYALLVLAVAILVFGRRQF